MKRRRYRTGKEHAKLGCNWFLFDRSSEEKRGNMPFVQRLSGLLVKCILRRSLCSHLTAGGRQLAADAAIHADQCSCLTEKVRSVKCDSIENAAPPKALMAG